MGIVRKQSIIGSFWVYLGAGLGFLTSAILLPHFFDAEQIGLINLLITYATLFAQLASAGFQNTITRMFPYFRDESKKHNGFLFVTLVVVAIASLIMIGVYFLTESFITENSSKSGNLMAEYSYLIIPLFLFLVFFNILDSYTKALLNATRGILMKEVVLRLLTLCLIVCFIFQLLDYHSFIHWYVVSYGLILLYMIVALIFERQFFLQPNFALFNKAMVREIFQVSLYGIIITSASIIVINLDRIMIEKLMVENPLAQVGIYTTCTYFATMVILPNRPLQKITSTLVAEAWKINDMKQLQTLYEKSTITQLIIGTLVFFGLCINLDYIFQIIPEEYSAGEWVIVFIGLFYLSDMAAGVNKDIVSNSPQYKKLSHWTIALIFVIIGLNYVFIPSYGITGAAVSSCVARILYNFVAFSYVHRKFQLQPYSYKHLLILVFGLLAYAITYCVPETNYLIANIILKSGILTLLFCGVIYFFHISEDVDDMVIHALKKLKR
ncbi:MAG: polysaccharide biosynthesis protein [Bacteroidales bacterium]|nr:polysaccharide biosynthesis protein [Bacteroidales bacterium]